VLCSSIREGSPASTADRLGCASSSNWTLASTTSVPLLGAPLGSRSRGGALSAYTSCSSKATRASRSAAGIMRYTEVQSCARVAASLARISPDSNRRMACRVRLRRSAAVALSGDLQINFHSSIFPSAHLAEGSGAIWIGMEITQPSRTRGGPAGGSGLCFTYASLHDCSCDKSSILLQPTLGPL